MYQQPGIQTRRVTDKLADIRASVGDTRLIQFPSLTTGNTRIYAKAEWEQAGGSVKARAAFAIIEDALRTGKWTQGKRLLDASSGNTAIAYASIAGSLGMACTICLPSNASQERKDTLIRLGAELIYTSPLEGTEGAQKVAREMVAAKPETYYYADQYSNPNNWKAHYRGTAREILTQTRGKVTAFTAGLGTTGSFCGTVKGLREKLSSAAFVALQPDSPMHGLEGWKHLETADTPAIYQPHLQDELMLISTEEAYAMIKFIARKEGLLLSPSSAANLVGAQRLASRYTEGNIITLLPDSIERYGEVKRELLS